ncbi:MAG: hypothetical protein U0166_16595 [Acidobacteriota bacterium]
MLLPRPAYYNPSDSSYLAWPAMIVIGVMKLAGAYAEGHEKNPGRPSTVPPKALLVVAGAISLLGGFAIAAQMAFLSMTATISATETMLLPVAAATVIALSIAGAAAGWLMSRRTLPRG